jgi:hypothetical protein
LSKRVYLLAVIRASIPKLELDDVSKQKNDIAKSVEQELEKAMFAYGYDLVQTLIVDKIYEETPKSLQMIDSPGRN